MLSQETLTKLQVFIWFTVRKELTEKLPRLSHEKLLYGYILDNLVSQFLQNRFTKRQSQLQKLVEYVCIQNHCNNLVQSEICNLFHRLILDLNILNKPLLKFGRRVPWAPWMSCLLDSTFTSKTPCQLHPPNRDFDQDSAG